MAPFLRRSQSAAAQSNGSNAFSFGASRSANNPSSSDPLQPLRAMADRVGKEVEKFAERVDHWHTHGNEDAKAKYQTTVKMVGKFRDLADSTVKELKKHNEVENKGDLNKSVRRRIQNMAEAADSNGANAVGQSFQSIVPSIESTPTSDSSSLQELRQWQAELATWELLRIVIDHYHPEPGTDVAARKRSRLAKVGGAMRYSPNSEIWDRFLLEDDQAKEKEIILRWLEQTARNSESDLEDITAELEAQSGKGVHTWTSGWLDTKAKIKQAKRLQGVDRPLDPGVVNLKSNDRTQNIVTQLDPDAPGRQKRSLEKADEYYERAVWLVCYEMLRRGVPWKEITDWAQERNETWRGVSIGAAYESHPSGGPNVAGETVGYLFRRMCFYASRGARISYEGAVYGLLSGDLKQVQEVCRSWDDHLYAHYNALLLSRFDGYLQQNHSHRISQNLARKFVFQDAVANTGDWSDSSNIVIAALKKAVPDQSESPIKLIQGSLISRTLDDLLYKVGIAVADLLQQDDRPVNLMVDPESDQQAPGPKLSKGQRIVTAEKYYQTLATNPHALRIIVHVFIALRKGLNLFNMDAFPRWAAMDNVITAYIEFLRVSKRMQLIPLYAAQLEDDRATHCLARILPDVKNAEEQRRCINLMQQYRIDAPEVVAESVTLALQNSGFIDIGSDGVTSFPGRIEKYTILEKTDDHEQFLWPGLRIRREFPGLEIEPQEEAIIESLLWYHHLEKEDTHTFTQLTDALLTFLINGRLGAAEKLIEELSIETLSLMKTQAHCGYAFDFTQPGAEEQDEDQVTQSARKSLSNSSRGSLRPSNTPNAQEHARHVYRLRELSTLYGDLQQLVRLLVLYREWREEEDKLIKLRDKGKVNTKRIKELFDAIVATFTPLIDSFDPSIHAAAEGPLWDLRKAYFPEIIIAYLAVMQAASFFIHRDSAIKAMDVATLVANDEYEWLQKVFLQTRRMSQLVDTIAQVSKAMLKLNEHGDKRTSTKKRGSKGETLRIWDLNVRN